MMKRSSKVIAIILGLIMVFSTVSVFGAAGSPVAKSLTSENVSVSNLTKRYNGNLGYATVTVTYNGKTLVKNTDYKVTGRATPKSTAGTYTLNINVTGIGKYSGSVTKLADYCIRKQYQKLTITPSKKTVYYSKLKKGNQYITMKTTGNKGAVTYSKSSGSKYLTVNKYGKITVKKGTKKGTYSIKVKVYAKPVYYKYYKKTAYKTVKVVVK